MIRIHKAAKFGGTWYLFETKTLKVDQTLEDKIYDLTDQFAPEAQKRSLTGFTAIDFEVFPPQAEGEYYWLTGKSLLQYRAAVGAPLFDSEFGDWPWDKADIMYYPEDVKELLRSQGFQAFGFYIWQY